MNTGYLIEERLLYPGKVMSEDAIRKIIESDAQWLQEEGKPLPLLKVVTFIRGDQREIHDFTRDENAAKEMLAYAREVTVQLKEPVPPSIIQ
jgi:hypothetical protein